MNALVTADRVGDIGVVTLNNSPVNALSYAVINELYAVFAKLLGDSTARGIALIGSGRGFCAGADIKEFVGLTPEKAHVGELLNPLFNMIELAAKPVVAAIHGTCLGGGLEMAMACHYRIATPDARLGQPEVKLGLIPGAGGTQRLPRLTGLTRAAEMCAIGNPISATVALADGILDQIAFGDLRTDAVDFVKKMVDMPPPRTRDRTCRNGEVTALDNLRKSIRNCGPHTLAVDHAITAVTAASRLSFTDGLRLEAKLFETCLYSEQSKALIHNFFNARVAA